MTKRHSVVAATLVAAGIVVVVNAGEQNHPSRRDRRSADPSLRWAT